MSWFESSGVPSPLAQPGEEHSAAPEPVLPLPPLQPSDEVQPLAAEPFRPLGATPGESFPLQQPETMQLQPVEPPPALEPLQPTMPPALPLLMAAEPTSTDPVAPPAAPPTLTPAEVANLGVPLGTLIFRAGLLTEEQLEDALQEGARSGKRLGEVLLESGLIDERDLGRLLADQKGLRFVELSSFALDPNATSLLSAEKAHMFAALPIGFEDGLPLVAVADPSNELVTENLRRALGKDPRLVVASRSDLQTTIDRLHATSDDEPAMQSEAELAPPAVEPLLQPEPVAPTLRPVQIEHVEVSQPETNGYANVAPLVWPEPAPARPRDRARRRVENDRSSRPAGPEPTEETTFSGIADEPQAQPAEQEFPSALSYDVSLRLSDGERVPIGSFDEPQKAREYARDVVKHLSDETDGWPFFSGRFMRRTRSCRSTSSRSASPIAGSARPSAPTGHPASTARQRVSRRCNRLRQALL